MCTDDTEFTSRHLAAASSTLKLCPNILMPEGTKFCTGIDAFILNRYTDDKIYVFVTSITLGLPIGYILYADILSAPDFEIISLPEGEEDFRMWDRWSDEQ